MVYQSPVSLHVVFIEELKHLFLEFQVLGLYLLNLIEEKLDLVATLPQIVLVFFILPPQKFSLFQQILRNRIQLVSFPGQCLNILIQGLPVFVSLFYLFMQI